MLTFYCVVIADHHLDAYDLWQIVYNTLQYSIPLKNEKFIVIQSINYQSWDNKGFFAIHWVLEFAFITLIKIWSVSQEHCRLKYILMYVLHKWMYYKYLKPRVLWPIYSKCYEHLTVTTVHSVERLILDLFCCSLYAAFIIIILYQ